MQERREGDEPAPGVLKSWGLAGARCRPITSGHINATFLVEGPGAGGPRFVLQRLNPIFGPQINDDIEAITSVLSAARMITPRPVRRPDGALCATDGAGRIWRLMTHVQGETLERADSPGRCRAAGLLVGRFHRALWRCDHVFAHRRLGIHDTPRHLAALRRALTDHADHRLFGVIEPVAGAILGAAADLVFPAGLPERVVHGDLKITNILFRDDEAVCLVDLDTLARMPLPLELGDALRSWCCPQGEEEEGALDLDFFEAAVSGHAAGLGGLISPAERAAIASAVEQIALELAARFCADALAESYFGWDRSRFGSAAEHNLKRARAQLSLARHVHEQLERMQELVIAAWR